MYRRIPFPTSRLINSNPLGNKIFRNHRQNISTKSSNQASFFATCHPGLEDVVAQELKSFPIHASNVRKGKAGVFFSVGSDATNTDAAAAELMMKSNLWLRSAIRVLHLLHEVPLDPRLSAGDSLYNAFRTQAIDWPSILNKGQTFTIESRIWGCTNLTNSNLVNVRGRDAICDAIRDAIGVRPSPPSPGALADLPLFVTAFQDTLRIYRDTSGVSLHRRGYRTAMHRASLNEAAASGCLALANIGKLFSDQTNTTVLADPMCGSGTFLIEAALLAQNAAPNLMRDSSLWPFLKWSEYSSRDMRQLWKRVNEHAKDERVHNPEVVLFGNDMHAGALGLTQHGATAAGVRHLVKLHHGDCSTWTLPRRPDVVVCNPPWGHRLTGSERGGRGGFDVRQSNQRGMTGGDARRNRGRVGRARDKDDEYDGDYNIGEDDEEELERSWHGLGTFLKSQASGGSTKAFILSGSRHASRYLRLKSSKKHVMSVGGVDARLLEYDIH